MTTEKSIAKLSKISLGISVFALIISGILLWQNSIYKSQNQYSYVEVLKAKYTKVDNQVQEQYLRITGTIELRNTGNIDVEIRDIYWQPDLGKDSDIKFSSPAKAKDPILFLSDKHEFEITFYRNFPSSDETIPRVDINNYVIRPHETKPIYFLLLAPRQNRGPIIELSSEDYYFISIYFRLNNGQEIITSPWYGFNITSNN